MRTPEQWADEIRVAVFRGNTQGCVLEIVRAIQIEAQREGRVAGLREAASFCRGEDDFSTIGLLSAAALLDRKAAALEKEGGK